MRAGRAAQDAKSKAKQGLRQAEGRGSPLLHKTRTSAGGMQQAASSAQAKQPTRSRLTHAATAAAGSMRPSQSPSSVGSAPIVRLFPDRIEEEEEKAGEAGSRYGYGALATAMPIPPSVRRLRPFVSSLEEQVHRMMVEMVRAGDAVGMQVAVYRRGELVVDVAGGELGMDDPRQVQSDTLFNVFSASKGVLAAGLHVLLEDAHAMKRQEDAMLSGGHNEGARAASGSLDATLTELGYGDRIGNVWPAFATNGKEDSTVADALTHSTGLAHHLPKGVTAATMCDHNKMENYLAHCKPMHPVGQRVAYHYYNYGWIVGGLLRRLYAKAQPGRLFDDRGQPSAAAPTAGGILKKVLLSRVGGHASSGELHLGVPEELVNGSAPRLARLCGDFGVTSRAVGESSDDAAGGAKTPAGSGAGAGDAGGSGGPDDGESGGDMPAAGLFGGSGGGGSGGGGPQGGMGRLMGLVQMASNVGDDDEDKEGYSMDGGEDTDPAHGAAGSTSGQGGKTGDGKNGKDGGVLSAIDAAAGRRPRPAPAGDASRAEMLGMLCAVKRVRGREYLIDPRLFNRAPLRQAEIPAANMHCSARALARVYACMRPMDSPAGATHALGDGLGRDGQASVGSRPQGLLSGERSKAIRTVAGRQESSQLQSLFAPGEGQGAAAKGAGSGGKSFLYWGLGYRLYLPSSGARPGGAGAASGVSGSGAWSGSDGYTPGGMRIASSQPVVSPAFGHTGVGGSIGLYDASSDTAVAITVNKLDFSMRPTRHLLEMLAFEMRLPHLRLH